MAAFCNKDHPNAGWDDISAEDKADAMKMGNKMGEVSRPAVSVAYVSRTRHLITRDQNASMKKKVSGEKEVEKSV